MITVADQAVTQETISGSPLTLGRNTVDFGDDGGLLVEVMAGDPTRACDLATTFTRSAIGPVRG